MGALEEMAPRGDPVQSRVNLFTTQADWITYHTIAQHLRRSAGHRAGISGARLGEGRAPLLRIQHGRPRISRTSLRICPAAMRCAKRCTRGPSGPVNLEVYYDPAHEFNVDEMLEASRAGLDYFQANFSPYQFTQYRIMEFPRYRTFAQSFPNTVPFSEGIGFITRVLKPTDVDLTYFVTAHELGHQWWGHQLVGGRVEGSNMMSETLAQYSAYMVMQQKYGKDYMRRVLRHFLDRYLRGRAGEVRRERPLALVQREDYVWYYKGGQIMYTLADYHRRGQGESGAARFPDAVPLRQRRQPGRRRAEHRRRGGRGSALSRYPAAGRRAARADAAGAAVPDRRWLQPHRPLRQQGALGDLAAAAGRQVRGDAHGPGAQGAGRRQWRRDRDAAGRLHRHRRLQGKQG